MKSTYFEYLSNLNLSKDKFKEPYFIAFDTNFLINLYKYSEETYNSFINIIEENKDKILLPYWVGIEYFEQRFNRIQEQKTNLDDFNGKFENFKNTLKSEKSQPHLSKTILDKFDVLYKEIKKEIDQKEIHLKNLKINDTILEKLLELFENKVTTKIDIEELKKLEIIAEERFKLKIPLGFRDENKDNFKIGIACKYSDYFIWNSLIEESKIKEVNIIFITDDSKEDWWIIESKNKTLHPHPQLISEFKKETNKDIYILNSEKFIKLFSKDTKHNENKEILNEIREINFQNNNSNINNLVFHNDIINKNDYFYDKDGNLGLIFNPTGSQGNQMLYFPEEIRIGTKDNVQVLNRHDRNDFNGFVEVGNLNVSEDKSNLPKYAFDFKGNKVALDTVGVSIENNEQLKNSNNYKKGFQGLVDVNNQNDLED